MTNIKHKKIKFLLTLFLVVFSLGIIGEASAATYYIATNGSDSNNGSISSPWATFNYAMSRLFAGDTLIVKAGTYNQRITAVRSGTAGNPITIQGELDGNGNRLSFINHGDSLTSWTSIGSGVYRAAYGQEASSMVLEISDETYDIAKLCHPNNWLVTTDRPGNGIYCNNWLSTLQTSANQIWYPSNGYITTPAPWWDGIEAAFASDGTYIYMRFRDSVVPTTKGTIRITPLGATINIGSYNYISIKNLKIKASQQGVNIVGGSNNIVYNNLIINGQRKVYMQGGSNNTISNNTMYAKSYSTYVNGNRLGYGAWNNVDNAPTQALKVAAAINYHSYEFYKYSCGASESSRDESGIFINGTSSCSLAGNNISEGDDGFILFNTSGCELSNNIVSDMHGIAIFPALTATNLSIHDNLSDNNNYFLRYDDWGAVTHSSWVYNNRSWLPQNIGGHIKWHYYTSGSTNNNKSIWFYHNSFSGGYEFSNVSAEIKNWSGNPFANVRFVDNIISPRRFEGLEGGTATITMGLCAYNWLGYLTTGQNWCSGATNISRSSLMWDTTALYEFNVLDSSAINAGIDISQTFTINGQTYLALPGFSPNYFTGSKPDMGAGESILTTQACTSFTYTAWSECQPNNTQTRTVASSSPSGCYGGNPTLTQTCTYNTGTPLHTLLKATSTPEIDGNLGEYALAESLTFSPSSGGNTVTVKTLWDTEALYFGIEVTDTQLNASVTTRDGSVWDEDSIEWLIDTYNDGGGSTNPNSPYMRSDDYQGIVNILNTKYDSQGTTSGTPTSSWNGTWQSAVRLNGTQNNNADTDNGYTIEIKIPWTSIGYSSAPSTDTLSGMSFAVNDKDSSGTYSKMWLSSAGSNQNASNWQMVLLSGQLATVDTIPPAAPLVLMIQ